MKSAPYSHCATNTQGHEREEARSPSLSGHPARTGNEPGGKSWFCCRSLASKPVPRLSDCTSAQPEVPGESPGLCPELPLPGIREAKLHARPLRSCPTKVVLPQCFKPFSTGDREGPQVHRALCFLS